MAEANRNRGPSARPRAVFFGTSQFACASLLSLIEMAEVTLVVTQPDRPSGRGLKLASPPVKLLAEQNRIEVAQPQRVRTGELERVVREQQAVVAVVAAYGRILPPGVLEALPIGCVNVHASLLPGYRGAAPINWAIVRGETETGVSLMQMDEGLDTGPVLARSAIEIGPDETAEELSARLARLGAELLRDSLPRLLRGELAPTPQDHARASLAPPLKKENGRIDWSQPALCVHNLVRGLNPWPGAFCWLKGRRVKLHRTHLPAEPGALGRPGVVVEAGADAILVACSNGLLAIDELQADGRRRMGAAEFLAGNQLSAGDRFTEVAE